MTRPELMGAYRVLVDRSSGPRAVLDLQGRLLLVNRAFAGLFGASTAPEDFPDVECSTLLSDPDAEFQTRILPRAVRGGWEGTLRLWRKDRSDMELRARISPVALGSEGGPPELLAAELLPAPTSIAPSAAPCAGAMIPILPIAQRVIVVPLVGALDARRSNLLMRLLLAGISAHRAKAVIVDVTGLSEIDRRSADYLAKTVLAARLKGARTVVSGLSEQASEALTDIDVAWKGIPTVGDLQTALVIALGYVGIGLESREAGDVAGLR